MAMKATYSSSFAVVVQSRQRRSADTEMKEEESATLLLETILTQLIVAHRSRVYKDFAIRKQGKHTH